MITEQQRMERVKYLGSSDAAAVLGLSRWKSPLAVWAEKTGQIVPEDISGKMQIRLGQKMEAVVAELFTEDTGLELEEVPETLYHPKYAFIAANLDRKVRGQRVLVELKHVGQYSKNEWSGSGAPSEYVAQVMHQLAVSGYEYAYLVALVGNTDVIVQKIERDEAALSALVEKEVEFWESFVKTGVMPATFTRTDKPVLEALFPEAEEGKSVELTDTEAAVIESIHAMEADLQSLEGQIEKSKNQLRAALGDAEAGRVGPHVVRWSNVNTTRLDVTEIKTVEPAIYKKYAKQSTIRRFLIQSKPLTRSV